MYKLKLTRREKKQLLRSEWLIVGLAILGVATVVWLAWVRPMQHRANINTFDECAKAGNPIQESYPEVCLTKDGKRFVNPKQQKSHQESLSGSDDLMPPTNPALLNLDVEEWDVRIPLTEKTFDLSYTYIENGGEEYLLFAYKRLIQREMCQGDIGMSLTRSLFENQPPFNPNKPAVTAKVDKYYYYVSHAGTSCYDAENAEQKALVAQITGDQSLTQVTTELLTKIVATPKE